MAHGGLWWRVAWRNLWRNPRRTVITASALAFGFLAAVLIVGVSDGIVQEMVENGTGIISGQIQVHAPGYRPERSLYSTIGGDAGVDVAALLESMDASPGVTGAAPRVYGGGLVSSGDETVAGVLLGIDPVREPTVSRVLSAVVRGRAPAPGARELLIGSEMARKLGVEPGAEVVLVAPAADGSLGNDLFVVSGVFRTGIAGLDGYQALLPIGALQDLLVLDRARVHEIAVSVADAWRARAAAEEVSARLEPWSDLVVVEPWTDFQSELADYTALAQAGNGIIVGIVFIMAIFGVGNTMLMSTYERRREFAVVRALGTSGGSVARTVVFEALMLGAMALALGALVTIPVMTRLHAHPVDLSGLVSDFTMAGSLVRPVIRVEYSVDGPALSAVALLLTALLAALFPAYRAVRVPPADALSNR